MVQTKTSSQNGSKQLGLFGPVSGVQPSLFRRIFVALALIAAITSVIVLISATTIYQNTVIEDANSMLEEECHLVASSLDGATEIQDIEKLALGELRATLIAKDGTVLYDNENDAATMANHASRPEVAQALAEGQGSSVRESETEGKVVIYHAILLDSGNVLRLEVERDSTASAVQQAAFMVFGVAVTAVIVAWILARFISAKLMEPILDINPAAPDESDTYVELNPVIGQIQSQMDEIRNADLLRREFTANVTHELKTPLSSISGAAELVRDRIAKPEDVPEFAGRIYDEAAHMTNLVNDILTLSKLDEAERTRDIDYLGKFEPIDLHQAALRVEKRLLANAHEREVELMCLGASVVVQGLPRLMDELIYNLVDNAIRYSKEGGNVVIETGKTPGGGAKLVVRDNGIGIPEDSLNKVFERFYRVDSSRTRGTGGTGLGLAIVKHAASVHDANIELESELGKGTTVTVHFKQSSVV